MKFNSLRALRAPWMMALAGGLALLASCNSPLVDERAPALVGSNWVLPSGTEVPAAETGQWRLVAFFAPT